MSTTTTQTQTNYQPPLTPPPLSPSTVYQHTFTVRVFSTEPLTDISDELSKGLYNGWVPGFKAYNSSYINTSVVPKTQEMIEQEEEE